MNDMMQRLAQADAQWNATAAMEGGAMHPPGRFQGQIEVFRLEEDNRPDNDTVYCHIEIKTQAGRAFQDVKLTNHPSERSIGFAKRQLQNIGYEGTLSGVVQVLDSMIGQWVEFRCEHDTYTNAEGEEKTRANIYLDRLVPPPAADAAPQAVAQPQAPIQAAAPAPAQPEFVPVGQVQHPPAPVAQPAAQPAPAAEPQGSQPAADTSGLTPPTPGAQPVQAPAPAQPAQDQPAPPPPPSLPFQ
jgi:hypothetical protein